MVIAQVMGVNVYLTPGVEGRISVGVSDNSPEATLALVLGDARLEQKFFPGPGNGRTLVIGPPDELAAMAEDTIFFGQGPGSSREFFLENVPAGPVMESLAGQYKNARFTPHATMNGFVVLATRKDMLAIRSELPNLDRLPEPPRPPVREFLPVKYGDARELRSALSPLVPTAKMAVDTGHNTLIVEGSPFEVDQVKELLAELDRPTDQVVLDVKVVLLLPGQRKFLGSQDLLGHIQMANRYGLQSPLQFLVSQNQARILAAPRAATANGQVTLVQAAGFVLSLCPTLHDDGLVELEVDAGPEGQEENCFSESVWLADGATLVLTDLCVPRDPSSGGLTDLVILITPHVMK